MEKESNGSRFKEVILIAFMVFMGVLLFFTFFSNTLQSLTLPKVRTEKPIAGSLVFTLEGSGILQPVAEARLSNSAGWNVRKILVKEGDRVKKGQKLMIYDSQSAERELEDEITNLSKQKIELQNMQDRFIQSAQDGDALKIRNAKRDIELSKLDLDRQERKIAALREHLTVQRDLSAPFDGMITKLNAAQGLASSGEPDILMSNSSLGYRLDIAADSTLLSSLGVSAGQKMEVEVLDGQDSLGRIVEGVIEEVANTQPRTGDADGEESDKAPIVQQKLLRLKVLDSKLRGGEQAQIKLEKHSRQEGLIISSRAIHQDRDGKFLFKIDVQRGSLGNIFVARKIRIKSSETTDRGTMIQTDNIYGDDLIILESSEPLQDGNRVRQN